MRGGEGGYPDERVASLRGARGVASGTPLRGTDSLSGMQDSSDDDAAPEEPSLESSASPSIRMSLNMGSLTSSGSNLFKEEDAAIKGGEVTLNFTDEAAGKEFRLNVRRQMPPHAHPDPHSSLTSGLPPRPIPSQFAVGQTVEFVKAKIKDEWERLDVGADAPVEVRMSCRTRPSFERPRPLPKMRHVCHRVSSWSSTARL